MKNSIISYRKSRIFSALFIGMLLSATNARAQQNPGWEERFPFIQDGSIVYLLAFGVVFFVAVLLLLASIYILYNLNMLLGIKQPLAQTAEQAAVAGDSFWVRVNKKYISGDLLPVEKEKDIMIDHDYDGITELDNHMPPWLRYTFYVTIFTAVVYVMHYWVLGTGPLQIEEYNQELAEAEAATQNRQLLASNDLDESNVVLISDAGVLEHAQTIYAQNCAACHGKDGGGTVGPNLTDEYWLHGGDVKDIFKVIKYGVQEKGMIPWDGKLSPEEIQGMASYILSLQGTTPANPKEPQGEKHTNTENENEVLSLK